MYVINKDFGALKSHCPEQSLQTVAVTATVLRT